MAYYKINVTKVTILVTTFVFCLYIIFTFLPSDVKYTESIPPSKIYESYLSSNQKHIAESIINPKDGVELYKDGKRYTTNLYGIEYNPVIGNQGDIAYLFVNKSLSSSMVFYNNNAIFDQDTICTNLKLVDTQFYGNQIIFSSYDKKTDTTTLFLYQKFLFYDNLKPLISLKHSSVDDIKVMPDNHVTLIVEDYQKGRKWKIYDINLSLKTIDLKTESSKRMFFAQNDRSCPFIDKIDMLANINASYLFNSYYSIYHNQYGEPFSYSNDFAGRLAWNEAYRIRGILELYKKTKDNDLLYIIKTATENIMSSRNINTGIENNTYNPSFAWSSLKYSLHDEPLCLMVNQCMIMDVLLQVANAGILDNKLEQEIYSNAEDIFNFYEKDYNGSGQYHFSKGSPFWCDGVTLPWNQQNVMVNVCLELYKATRHEKYLQRSMEMTTAFMSEIKEDNGCIYWYYWPEIVYKGWTDQDDISVNTPQSPPIHIKDKTEDISHAGINADTLVRFNSIVYKDDAIKTKIENNMCLWIDVNGFKTNISGKGKSYNSIIPNGYWGILSNPILAQYAALGPNMKDVPFDRRTSFVVLSASYYDENASDETKTIPIQRLKYTGHGEWILSETLNLPDSQIKNFIKQNYIP